GGVGRRGALYRVHGPSCECVGGQCRTSHRHSAKKGSSSDQPGKSSTDPARSHCRSSYSLARKETLGAATSTGSTTSRNSSFTCSGYLASTHSVSTTDDGTSTPTQEHWPTFTRYPGRRCGRYPHCSSRRTEPGG